jgi:hypothetical protein|tara:strand:+ start:186 stop:1238 length:1053 start_codon:yes stop_codon:yes gene_type:complete
MSEIDNFFTPLEDTDKRTNVPTIISSPVWSGGAATLSSFYTGSAQSQSSGDYYLDVFDKVGTDSTREVQFAVAYGHYNGSGSLSTSTGNNPSMAVYRQFRNVGVKNSQSTDIFKFPAGNTNSLANHKDIYVLSINRARYREKLDPGNWELWLGTGSNRIKLIDDSGATADSSVKASERVFNVVSGSIQTGTAVIATGQDATTLANDATGTYGLVYPELGLIVLNATALDASPLSLATAETADVNENNHQKLVTAISQGGKFQARREEQIKSSHYFCRVQSDKYNWSQNPTYFQGTNAELTNTTFIQDPKSYITTVGLYNQFNELLAVAKLSQPLLKSRDREAVIKVRLDF